MLDPLPRYRTGDRALDQVIGELVESVDEADQEFVFELIVSAIRMGREDVDRGDLKLVTAALKELRYSFHVFAPYRDIRKCAIFGSARTSAGDPGYAAARDFASAITAKGWMVITGAGPGIMEAGHAGAGAENSFGVNIVLPFETGANPVIAEDPKLVNYRYFFTRKLMFVKESHGFVLLPGGFGTMDEAFELLTLMQTGKTDLAPVVLLDPSGGSYWPQWRTFVEDELVEGGLISPDDLGLVKITDSVDAAVDDICRFYRTFHSQRFVGSRLILRLQRDLSDSEIESLNDEFGDIVEKGSIERADVSDAELRDRDEIDRPRIALKFDRRHWARLRHLIDTLNAS